MDGKGQGKKLNGEGKGQAARCRGCSITLSTVPQVRLQKIVGAHDA